MENIMSFKLLNTVIAITILSCSFFTKADTATGKVTTLRSTLDSQGAIYFKLDSMPTGVSKWLYVKVGTTMAAGCQLKGSQDSLNRAYSTLLTAKSSSQSISIGYCIDSNGYGLVNGYIELD
jgi:hypothetical protein